ncbi:MarR family winged helix-turn-helix transcriptional regulator [Paracoccus sp. p4-l81]|uniref:MarR family winged helix-turn-helix transcriptional regulator n=1 Tax=Paracoccus sp. p4-l81 TaxID=3342806 RepID=UPI0035BA1448
MDNFDLGRFLPFRLNRLAERLSRAMIPIYRDGFGMTRAEWRVLAHLRTEGAATASALVVLTAMDKVKISRAIAALEGRGWIARAADPADRRVNHLHLTTAGRAVLDALTPQMVAGEQAALSRLSDDQRRRIAAALDDLEAAFAVVCADQSPD